MAAFSNGVQQKHSQLAGNENNDGYCSNVSLYTDWPSCCRRCCKYDRPTAAKYSLLRNANVLISQPDIAIFFFAAELRLADFRFEDDDDGADTKFLAAAGGGGGDCNDS